MYSAVKINGKKLYEFARQGKEVDRAYRWVDIHNIQILGYDSEEYEVKLRVDCGKGTYIRTLLYDIGEFLGCGGAMKSLVRTRVGEFDIKDSLRLSQVEKHVSSGTIQDYIIKIDEMFLSYPKVVVSERYSKLIYNGNSFKKEHIADSGENIDEINQEHIPVRVYDSKGKFVGIYNYDIKDRVFHVKKCFVM